MRARSQSVGDVIVETSGRFWGGSAGWDDPDVVKVGQVEGESMGKAAAGEHCGGGAENDDKDETGADLDMLEVSFVAAEPLVKISIFITPAVKGQQVGSSTAWRGACIFVCVPASAPLPELTPA